MASDERRLIAGTYEPWIHNLLPHILRDGCRCGVGAHIGYDVITACALSRPGIISRWSQIQPTWNASATTGTEQPDRRVIVGRCFRSGHNVQFESNSGSGGSAKAAIGQGPSRRSMHSSMSMRHRNW